MNQVIKNFFETQVQSYSNNFSDRKSGNNFCFTRRLALIQAISQNSQGRLLDCAVGTGEITRAVLDAGNFDHADLVDISPQMLRYAEQSFKQDSNLSQCCFLESDIFSFLENCNRCNKSYDLVLCIGLIAHTGQLPKILDLVRGCLNSKGRLILQSSLLDHWGFRLVRSLTRDRYVSQKGYSLTDFYLKDICDAVRNSGFEILATYRFSFYFPFGDKLWPQANFYLEKIAQGWATKRGSEAIFVLTPKQ